MPRRLSPLGLVPRVSPPRRRRQPRSKRDRVKDFDRAGLRLGSHEEILVYPLLKQRLRRPQVRFRVRLHEQERAFGGPQRVGTTSMKMTKNPNEGLRRILAERKREIVKEIQDKFRDVRAEAEWKETKPLRKSLEEHLLSELPSAGHELRNQS